MSAYGKNFEPIKLLNNSYVVAYYIKSYMEGNFQSCKKAAGARVSAVRKVYHICEVSEEGLVVEHTVSTYVKRIMPNTILVSRK